MNLSIFLDSVRYLTNFKSIVSLSFWINQELTSIYYNDNKLKATFSKGDVEVFRSIIHLIQDKTIFDKYINTTSFYVNEFMLRDDFNVSKSNYMATSEQLIMLSYLIENHKNLGLNVTDVNIVTLDLLKRNKKIYKSTNNNSGLYFKLSILLICSFGAGYILAGVYS